MGGSDQRTKGKEERVEYEQGQDKVVGKEEENMLEEGWRGTDVDEMKKIVSRK